MNRVAHLLRGLTLGLVAAFVLFGVGFACAAPRGCCHDPAIACAAVTPDAAVPDCGMLCLVAEPQPPGAAAATVRLVVLDPRTRPTDAPVWSPLPPDPPPRRAGNPAQPT